MQQGISKDDLTARLLTIGRLDGAVEHGGLIRPWQIRAAILGFADGARLPDKRGFYLSLLRGDETKDTAAFWAWHERLFSSELDPSPPPLPVQLYQSGLTQTILPCLTQPHKLQSQAERGLVVLKGLIQYRALLAQRLGHKKSDQRLWQVAALSLKWPALTPLSLAGSLRLSISGAGKLLQRAARLNICVEITGQHNYKLYIPGDCVSSFGLGQAAPRNTWRKALSSPMDQKYDTALRQLDDALKAFDNLPYP